MKHSNDFNTFINDIEQRVSYSSFNNWFMYLQPYSLSDKKWLLEVPLEYFKNKLNEKEYKDVIEASMLECFDKVIPYEFLLKSEIQKIEEQKKINVEDIELLEIDEPFISNLNPKYTFDTFMVGDSNKLATFSAKETANNPGTLYNPLFIYGKSGLGKTHLMHAIGNYIVDKFKKKVLYVTSNEFKDDITKFADNRIVKLDYAKQFKDKYLNIDVLLIDDIQFLVDASKSQEEFFNIFNTLNQANKQIIITSDRSANDLQRLEDRLKSRFNWGLTINIEPPDFKLRCKIIRSKIKYTILEDKLNDEMVEYIANACQSDVRFIENTINRIMAYISLWKPEEFDLSTIVEALKDFLNVGNVYADNSLGKIQKVVADYYNITVNDLKGKKRTKNIAIPRHIAIYLCREMTTVTLAEIGLEFGGKDHSTISASIDKITKELKTDQSLNDTLKELKNML